MKMIIIDLEMNQPSNKIIEIGAVLVDLKRKKILGEFSELCNPGELPSLEFKLRGGMTITELTGITPEMVSEADSSKVVHDRFWRWVEKSETGGAIAAWGSDVHQLVCQSKEIGVATSHKIRSFDIKALVTLFRVARGGKTKGGLSNSLQTFGLEFEGRQHRALDDARNTANLLFTIFEKMEQIFAIEKLMTPKNKQEKKIR